MAYHHDFWITVGTVAPVLALAHTVAVGRYRSRVFDMLDPLGARVDDLTARSRGGAPEPGTTFSEITAEYVDVMKEVEKLRALGRKAYRSAQHVTLIDWLAVASWALCGLSLAFALVSLAGEKDATATWWVIIAILLSMAALIVPPIVDAEIRRSIGRLKAK